MLNQIQLYSKKPALYAPSTAKFWDDLHISKGMLEAHLNPTRDAASRNHDYIRKSAHWIAETLPSGQYPSLLDLGCGPGLYAEAFHAAGYRVTGMDVSARSIRHAQQSASASNLDILYLQGNYLDISLQEQYDLITLIYCDFGALPSDDRARLLRQIHGLLRPGGVFLFDVFTPAAYTSQSECHSWEFCADGGFWSAQPYLYLHSLYRYEDAGTFLRRHIVATESNVNCYNIWEHTFTEQELTRDLQAAGLRISEFYGDIAGKPRSEVEETICVMSVK